MTWPKGLGRALATAVVAGGLLLAVAGPAAAAGVAGRHIRPLSIAVGSNPTATAFDGSNVWVTTDNGVSKIDPATNSVVATVPISPAPASVTYGARSIWVASGTSVSRIDPRHNVVTKVIPMPSLYLNLGAIQFGAGSVWVANERFDSRLVFRINPWTGAVVTIDLLRQALGSGEIPHDLAFDGTDMWVSTYNQYRSAGLDKISSATNTVTGGVERQLQTSPRGIGSGSGSLWSASIVEGPPTNVVTFDRIDPATNAVIAVINWVSTSTAFRVAPGGGSMWVTNGGGNTVTRIDPHTNTVSATVKVGSNPVGIVYGKNSMWVANEGSNTVSRIPAG